MALDAGELAITLEFAHGLKDKVRMSAPQLRGRGKWWGSVRLLTCPSVPRVPPCRAPD